MQENEKKIVSLCEWRMRKCFYCKFPVIITERGSIEKYYERKSEFMKNVYGVIRKLEIIQFVTDEFYLKITLEETKSLVFVIFGIKS